METDNYQIMEMWREYFEDLLISNSIQNNSWRSVVVEWLMPVRNSHILHDDMRSTFFEYSSRGFDNIRENICKCKISEKSLRALQDVAAPVL